MLKLLDSFDKLIDQDPIFWCFALLGSFLFALQLLLTFMGGSSNDDMNDGADIGKFKWMSKQALTGFLMMFGWVGLTCRQEFHLSILPASIIAFGGGMLALIMTALIFRAAKKLHSSGSVFHIDDVVGKTATVYQRIPKGGVGKISLSLHDLTYDIDAVSYSGEEIVSFTQVQVLKKIDDKTVFVVPIQ